MHISTNDLHCCKPARLLQLAPSGGRPRRRPPATAPPRIAPPHQQRRTAASKRPPHSNAAAKTTQPIHTSPGPAQNPHTPTQPTAAATTKTKPRSNSQYGNGKPQSLGELELGKSLDCNSSTSRVPQRLKHIKSPLYQFRSPGVAPLQDVCVS